MMRCNRRGFLGALLAAPAALVAWTHWPRRRRSQRWPTLLDEVRRLNQGESAQVIAELLEKEHPILDDATVRSYEERHASITVGRPGVRWRKFNEGVSADRGWRYAQQMWNEL